MLRQESHAMVLITFLLVPLSPRPLLAQEPAPTASPQQTPAAARAPGTGSFAGYPPEDRIIVPAGTRVPLLLRNAVNTGTAKAGDSVYFETLYPIAVNNRIVIPMGTFVRGEILLAKRPGRIRGRGELRLALEQMTYPNGYTIELGSRVNEQKNIQGPSSSLRDTTTVLLTAAGGAYMGTLSGAVGNDAPGKGALVGGGIGGMLGLRRGARHARARCKTPARHDDGRGLGPSARSRRGASSFRGGSRQRSRATLRCRARRPSPAGNSAESRLPAAPFAASVLPAVAVAPPIFFESTKHGKGVLSRAAALRPLLGPLSAQYLAGLHGPFLSR